MNWSEIIAGADLLVPNEVPVADKVVWANALNQDFFNVVKIPQITQFDCIAGQTEYPLSSNVRCKNIDLVLIGMFPYQSLERDNVTPAQNAFVFDDLTSKMSLYPAPYGPLRGVVRHRRIATSTVTSGTLSTPPDAPPEYHWTFIPGLAAFIANTQDDSVKAANYEAQCKAAWNVAAQAYTEVPT